MSAHVFLPASNFYIAVDKGQQLGAIPYWFNAHLIIENVGGVVLARTLPTASCILSDPLLSAEPDAPKSRNKSQMWLLCTADKAPDIRDVLNPCYSATSACHRDVQRAGYGPWVVKCPVLL